MFVGKARSLHLSGASERCFFHLGSNLTSKQTRLERLARDKHSSLLQKSINYRQKGFITLGPVWESPLNAESPQHSGNAQYISFKVGQPCVRVDLLSYLIYSYKKG